MSPTAVEVEAVFEEDAFKVQAASVDEFDVFVYFMGEELEEVKERCDEHGFECTIKRLDWPKQQVENEAQERFEYEARIS